MEIGNKKVEVVSNKWLVEFKDFISGDVARREFETMEDAQRFLASNRLQWYRVYNVAQHIVTVLRMKKGGE